MLNDTRPEFGGFPSLFLQQLLEVALRPKLLCGIIALPPVSSHTRAQQAKMTHNVKTRPSSMVLTIEMLITTAPVST